MAKKAGKRTAVVCLVIAVIVVLLLIPFLKSSSAERGDESIRSIAETVQERALQCYVIEGAYPDSLSYLEDNYGLTLNEEEYLVVYTPVAENLPPDIRVVARDQ